MPTWVLALVAIAIGVLGVVAGVRLSPGGGDPEPATLSLLAPPGVTFGPAADPTDMQSVAISPDGRQLAFVAEDTTAGTRLRLRDLSRDNARPLANTEDAQFPFWSPDGRRLGFFADKKLKTLNLRTGAVRQLANTPAPGGGAWGRDVILYQPGWLGPLWSVPERGGAPAAATVVDSTHGEIGHRFPQFLPGGGHYIASIVTKTRVAAGAGEIGSPRLRPLFTTNWRGAVFTAGDWLVAPRSGLKAQRFDPRTLQFSGPEIDIQALHLDRVGVLGQPCLSASTNGIVVQQVPPDLSQRLSLVNRQGRVIQDLAAPVGEYSRPNISPDGKWLAYVPDESGPYECHVRSFTGSEGPVQVVSRGAGAVAGTLIGMPVWRRDGRELLYVAADERTLMTVSVTPGDPPAFGEPQALFRLPEAIADIGAAPNLDKFLLSITRERGRSAATVMLNFPRMIEREE